jgi:8-oxo-dGTP pyrophosphatase MutT (NUDIX family)
MRELFSIDSGDYDEKWPVVVRPSCRSIIIKDGKVALVHSMLYDYYKFPGGGMNEGESREETLIRETREEAGLEVIPDSIREYGYVRRKQKGNFPNMGKETIFLQDNYYYFVKVSDEKVRQDLDEYEDEEHFTLEYIDPLTAIKANLKNEHGPKDRHMIDRETRVLSMLIREGHV